MVRTMIVKPNGDDIVGVIHAIADKKRVNSKNIVDVHGTTAVVDGQNWAQANILVDYSATAVKGESNWCSTNTVNSYFIIIFKQYLIHITDYTLISRNFNPYDMPKNWVVKGSKDNVNWEYIDHRISDANLKTGASIKTFHVNKQGKYTHFMFTQNGTNWNGRNFFTLGKVDLFGKVYETFYGFQCSCKWKERRFNIMIYILFLDK